jgi:hypothetical protein
MKALTCEACGLAGVPTQVTFYQMVSGWRRVHPKGGSVINQRPEQRFLCGPCVEGGNAHGLVWEQQELFPA